MFFRSLLYFLVFAALFSCNKNDDGTLSNSNDDCSISLTISKVKNNISLSWTKPDVPDFEGYYLVRSDVPIDGTPVPVDEFEIITDIEQTSFTDSLFPVENTLYYKVYVKTERGFSCNDENEIETGFELLEFYGDFDVVHSAESGALFYRTKGSSPALYRIDYMNREITKVIDDFSGVGKMFITQNNGAEELVALKNYVEFYDIVDFNLLDSFSVPGMSIYNMAIGGDLIFMNMSSYDNPILVYSRSSLDSLSSNQEIYIVDYSRKIYTLLGVGNNVKLIVYETEATGRVDSYLYGTDGKQLGPSVVKYFPSAGFSLPEIVSSPDNEYFVIEGGGTVFNSNLEVVTTLSPSTGIGLFISDVTFSLDGDRVFAIKNGEMVEFDISVGEVISKISLPYSARRIFRSCSLWAESHDLN